MKPAGARIVVVLGMHRSGTSLITRGLEVLGVSLGERLMPPADGNNAKGFFEDIDVNALNVAMLSALGSDWQGVRPLDAADFAQLRSDGWVEKALAVLAPKTGPGHVFGFKDPRTAKLLPFWQEVFAAGGYAVKYLLALRNPASVADSLASRDGMPRERSYYLWLEHVLSSLMGTIGAAPVLVDYDDFFGDADRVLARMASGLELGVNIEEREEFKEAFIDDALRHTVHSGDDLSRDPACPALVREICQALKAASIGSGGVDSPQLRAALVRWNEEFARMAPALRLADMQPAMTVQAAPEAGALEVLKAVARYDTQLLYTVFDQQWYVQAYPDVANAGIHPFSHYSEAGVHEGRHPGADVAGAAQRALAALVGGRDAPLGGDWIEQARRDEQRWADMMELQRSFKEREGKLTEQSERAQHQLHAAQEQRAARELVHAATVATMQGEQAERIAVLTREAQERQGRHQQQLDAARERGDELAHRLGELESAAQAREAVLRAAHTEELARLQREREVADAASQGRLAAAEAELASAARQREAALQALHAQELARLQQERDESEALRRDQLAQAAAERAALEEALGNARADIDAIQRSFVWRTLAPLVGRGGGQNR